MVVAGTSVAPGTPMGIVVLKYDAEREPGLAGRRRATTRPPGIPTPADATSRTSPLTGPGNVYVAGASEYRVGGVWIESALVVKFAAADGVQGRGVRVRAPPQRQLVVRRPHRTRLSTVVGVGETWDPADAKPEDALVARLSLSLAQKYRKEWGAGNKTSEWFGDAVIDGKGNVYVDRRPVGRTPSGATRP